MDYLWFLAALLFCSIFTVYASAKVNSTFSKYNRVANLSGMTGYDAAVRIMRSKGLYDLSIGRISGNLTDHYNPKKGIVNLSESTYGNPTVAAVAVAAHEMGHVMQKENGYFFYKVRTALVPVVNFGSRLAFPLVIIGLLLDIFVVNTSADYGFYIAMAGVILYGGSFLFALITYPVEVNASRRAKKMLLYEGILADSEIDGAKRVLSAAALTYLASLLTSLVYFLRFFIYVVTLFGRRGGRD